MSFALLLPAAGDGSRLGLQVPKALIELGGLPLFVHSLFPFLELAECGSVIVAAPPPHVRRFQSLVSWFLPGRHVQVVAGGSTRQESVGLALKAADKSHRVILVHDAARPFVSRDLIRRVSEGLGHGYAGCAPALPLSDTVKRASGNPPLVESTIDRRHLYTVQTPQALHRETFEIAYEKLAADPFEGTDDVSLIEHFGLGDVHLVEADPRNIKITTPIDLEFARERLATAR